MILEKADLFIKAGMQAEFEAGFALASKIISSMPGYRSHRLLRCEEIANKYLLLVWWECIADHEQGFRGSPEYQEWRRLLHHFYEPFPVVEHFHMIYHNP